MLGIPKETREQSMKTIQFAMDSGLDYAIFPITEPFPGTELWVDAEKYGTFEKSGDYKNELLSENSAVWVPHGRTRVELEKLAKSAIWKFYLRPRVVWRGLMQFRYAPIQRVLRYFYAGIHLFIVSHFSRSRPGTHF